MTPHAHRVITLQEAYKSGRTFPTIVRVRDYLGCSLDQAKRADLEARNDINANPSTSVVVPAPKVPEPGTTDYARRSRGNADHDLVRLLAFYQEIVTKTTNADHQARKISEKHPADIDIMRLSREAAYLARQAVSVTIEIERVRSSRN